MILRAPHLREERLLECYMAERQGETVDPPAAEHLADCSGCAARYADLALFMDQVRIEAEAEADEVFTAERLRAQHVQIARRLETVARPARVITFPAHASGPRLTVSAVGHAPRWVAAAAAAGLFIGIALGASYRWDARVRGGGGPGIVAPEVSAGRSTRLAPVATRGDQQADVAADDAFLSELELAVDRPHTRELMAIDAFTPQIREVRANR